MNILNEIHKIVKEDYPQIKEKITPKTKFADVKEIDSLELAMMVIKLEKICKIRIDDDILIALQTKTVQDLINEIEKLMKDK